MLRQENGVGESDVAGSGNGDFHVLGKAETYMPIPTALPPGMTVLQGWQPDFASFAADDEEIFCSATRAHIGVCNSA
jgi:hypothetical protein